jgi:hypothetical protein
MAELEEDAPGEAPPQPAVYEPRTAKLEAELTARRAQTARRAKLLSEAETLRAQGVKPSAAAQPVSSAAAARTKALTELEAKVTAARDALGRESAYQESILARDRLSRRLEALQAACEFLAPKGGALDQALGRAMDGILSDANELLQGWGMSLRLQEDPFGLYLRDHDVNLPLTRASSSQQWLISAVLAIAIAVPLGWRTIVLDGADILRGPENKSRLPSLLSEAARRELMLIVTTADPPPTEIARVAGVERWQIVAGERGPAFVPIDREKEVP